MKANRYPLSGILKEYLCLTDKRLIQILLYIFIKWNFPILSIWNEKYLTNDNMNECRVEIFIHLTNICTVWEMSEWSDSRSSQHSDWSWCHGCGSCLPVYVLLYVSSVSLLLPSEKWFSYWSDLHAWQLLVLMLWDLVTKSMFAPFLEWISSWSFITLCFSLCFSLGWNWDSSNLFILQW